MYPATTCWGLATEFLSNGKIVYDGFLSESFNILMLMPKTFEVACVGALSAHSLSVDKFETHLSKLATVSLSILVFNNFLYSVFSKLLMLWLIVIQLMCNSSKETIAISTHIYQYQISFSKLFLQVWKELIFFFFGLCLSLFLIFFNNCFAKVVLNFFLSWRILFSSNMLFVLLST